MKNISNLIIGLICETVSFILLTILLFKTDLFSINAMLINIAWALFAYYLGDRNISVFEKNNQNESN